MDSVRAAPRGCCPIPPVLCPRRARDKFHLLHTHKQNVTLLHMKSRCCSSNHVSFASTGVHRRSLRAPWGPQEVLRILFYPFGSMIDQLRKVSNFLRGRDLPPDVSLWYRLALLAVLGRKYLDVFGEEDLTCSDNIDDGNRRFHREVLRRVSPQESLNGTKSSSSFLAN